MKFKLTIIALAVFLLPASAMAGWVFTDQDVDMDTGKPEKTFIQGGKMATGQSLETVDSIFDMSGNKLILLNRERRIYWQGTPQEMKDNMISAMDEAMAARTEGMSDQEAAQVKAMMEAMKAEMLKSQSKAPNIPPVTIEKMGAGEKIAGYDTVIYQVSQEGQPVARIWVAPDVDTTADLDAEAMLRMIQSVNPVPDYSSDKAMLQIYKKGYPLKIVEFDEGMPEVQEQVGKVEKVDLPAALFAPPAGYKKASLGEVAQ